MVLILFKSRNFSSDPKNVSEIQTKQRAYPGGFFIDQHDIFNMAENNERDSVEA